MAVLATGVTQIPPPYPNPAQPWVDVPIAFQLPIPPPPRLGMLATVQLLPAGAPPPPPPPPGQSYVCTVVSVQPNRAVVRVHGVGALPHGGGPLFLAWVVVD